MLPPSSPTSSGRCSAAASGTASSSDPAGKQRRPATTAVTAVVVARNTSTHTEAAVGVEHAHGDGALARLHHDLAGTRLEPGAGLGDQRIDRVQAEPAAVLRADLVLHLEAALGGHADDARRRQAHLGEPAAALD